MEKREHLYTVGGNINWYSHRKIIWRRINIYGFPDGSVVKNQRANAGDAGSTPRLGRSPAEGNGNPLQCSCLENPMDREAWWSTVHGVIESLTQLRNWTTTKQLNHFAVHQKLTQYCKSTILQLKKKASDSIEMDSVKEWIDRNGMFR